MKKYIYTVLAAVLSVTVLPAVPVYIAGAEHTAAVPELHEYIMPDEPEYSGEPYRVLNTRTGKVEEVAVRDYVIGAVGAEMPATFEPEALKAQAVAAHTYAERQRNLERITPTKELCGADFSDDTAKYQGYITKSEMQEYYGDKYEEYYGKISSAADEVMDMILTYRGEPAIAAFHSMSPGRTESAENAWGAPVDYLIPVDSPADTSAPRYMDEVRYTEEMLRSKLESGFPGIELSGDRSEWIEIAEVSDSGTVLKVRAGDRTVSGNELRIALGLRSACFSIENTADETVVTTRGFGHGVGMSQYGANAMAADGSSWREILAHYYPGCDLKEAVNR